MHSTGFYSLLLLSWILLTLNRYVPSEDLAAQQDSLVTASIAVVGDLMCHSVQYNYAKTDTGFDFTPVYRYVKEFISTADFAFGNLETVTAGKSKGYSGYPFFNSPDEYITALADAGFDLLTTSNNHSLDRGEEGLRRTIQKITENEMGYNGTFVSEQDRDSIRLFNINGIEIAFLAYSYGTNGLPVPKGKNYLINLIDTLQIKKDVEMAREMNPDIILVHYHFGEEYKREPSKYQLEIAEKTFSYGADIIIGGHPHVIQRTEFQFLTGNKIDTGFVAYSLGNFISNQRWRYSDAGVILILNIEKNISRDEVSVKNVSVIPTWVYKGKTGMGNQFIILHPEAELNDFNLNAEDKNKMDQSFKDTKSIIGSSEKILFP